MIPKSVVETKSPDTAAQSSPTAKWPFVPFSEAVTHCIECRSKEHGDDTDAYGLLGTAVVISCDRILKENKLPLQVRRETHGKMNVMFSEFIVAQWGYEF